MRKCIFVPEELAGEMDKHPDENWSKIFQDAVRQRLGLEDHDHAPEWFVRWFKQCVKDHNG